MQERKFEGIWWLPDRPDHPVGGHLEVRRDTGQRLEVLGELLPSLDSRSAEAKVPVVFGSVAGSDVTLFDVWRGKSNFTIGGRFAKQEYRPELIVLGTHLPVRSDLSSAEWIIHLTQFAEWLEIGGFHVESREPGSDKSTKPLFKVTYTPVDLPDVVTADLTLSFGFETTFPIGIVRSLNLRELPYVSVKLDAPVGFDVFRTNSLWKLQNFFTFATDRPSTVNAVYVTLPAAERLEVIYHSRFEPSQSSDPWTMLFTYPTVAERAATLLAGWFELYERLGPVLNTVFSVIYGNIRSVDTKFLNLAQAAESYHRRMFDPAEMVEVHQERLVRILSAAPPDEIEWLKGKLAFSHEPFLNERLIALFSRLGSEFTRPMFATNKKMESAAWRIADWRNKLTHMRATPNEIATNLIAIHVCANQLLVCLKANLLLDLGFTHQELATAFKYNDMYNYGAHRGLLKQ